MQFDLSRFAINQITTPKWSMPEALEGYRRHGIGGIAVWRNFDRGMVGDGVAYIPRIKGWLDEIGYTGPFELEIFSELDWWNCPPEETVRVAIERCGPYVQPLI